MINTEIEALRSALPRFTDFHLLGSGGMGSVYRAWDKYRTHYVALKLIIDDGGSFAKRFAREYNLLKSSPHDRLVIVYDAGECQILVSGRNVAFRWFTMDSCETVLSSSMHHMTLHERICASLQMIEGIAFLHERDVVHRDIKPHNIFLRDGNVKIGDFGLAKELMTQENAGSTGVTPPGAFLGTPQYMAPERWSVAKRPPTQDARQLDLKEADTTDWRPADQYALGITIYEVLSKGERPFTIETGQPWKWGIAHLTHPVSSIMIPEHPEKRFPEIDKVLAKMLAKQPEDRYRSLIMCKDDLRSACVTHGLYRAKTIP